MPEVPFFITEHQAANPVPSASPKARKQAGKSRRAPRYRISLVKEAGSIYVTSKPITSPKMILEQLTELFEDIDREAFYIIMLDTGMRVIGVNLVSVGTLNASLVHPREVFKAAILLNAGNVMGVHNHPGGAVHPSVQDRELTKRLEDAGQLLGIRFADHVIVADDQYFSFHEMGLM